MIFICGTIAWEDAGSHAPAVAAMAQARRAMRAGDAPALWSAHAHLAHAGCSAVQVTAGSRSAWLFRLPAEERPDDESRLAALLATYGRSGQLLPVAMTGAFVLIVVDPESRHAVLATDRFAICPLYYRALPDALVFSSDIDAVMAHPAVPRSLDPQAIYDYVFFHSIPGPRTIYRDVCKLGPAEMLEWDTQDTRCTAYWRPRFEQAGNASEAAGSTLVGALEAAVRQRVRPHCGAFLSGGLDSSTVSGLLKQVTGEAATFTIGFDAEGYDESGYARIAARHFATSHHEYFVTPADVSESLPRIAAYYGEPFGNSSVVPAYQCARFARTHGVQLMLAGDGGDELFAGNTRYVDQRKFEAYFSVPPLFRALLETGYRALPLLGRLPVSGKGARYIKQARMGLPDRLQSYNFLNRFDPHAVFEPDWLSEVDIEAPWRLWRERYAAPVTGDALQRMLYLDWKFTLADNDLVKVSRMCDLAGVDVCYPMLDDAVVDLAATLTSEALLPGGELRGFYKRAFTGMLPHEVIAKTKHGFGLPFGVWMREDCALEALAQGAIDDLGRRGVFRPAFLHEARRLFREESAAGYYGELVWILTMLELWLCEHP